MADNIKMEEYDFPSLYQISDKSSLIGQRKYLNFFRLEQIALISGAIVSLFPLDNPKYGYVLAICSAICFATAIAITVYMKSSKFENNWYIGRAVAESIKTLTWRYITKGEPFVDGKTQEEIEKHFCGILTEILKENGEDLDLTIQDENTVMQITNKMREIRNRDFDERKKMYIENRVKDQLSWYQRKSKLNQDAGTKYFRILIICQTLALICSLILIKFPNLFNGVPLITTIAASIIAWTQVKQFEELAQAYGTTALDISLILSQIDYLNDENKFSIFVSDSENAFSREHTLWLARKDVYNYSSK